jgi:hypothetical protein
MFETTVQGGKPPVIVNYNAKGEKIPSVFESHVHKQRKQLTKMVAKARLAEPPKRRKKRDPAEAASSATFIQTLLATITAPALQWLSESTEPAPRTLGEMDTALSTEFVNALHELGAAEVLAVQIEMDPGSDAQTTNHLVAKLPDDPPARARIMAFDKTHASNMGFESEGDWGQDHVYMMLC